MSIHKLKWDNFNLIFYFLFDEKADLYIESAFFDWGGGSMPLLRNKADWAATCWADFELPQSSRHFKARPYSKQ